MSDLSIEYFTIIGSVHWGANWTETDNAGGTAAGNVRIPICADGSAIHKRLMVYRAAAEVSLTAHRLRSQK